MTLTITNPHSEVDEHLVTSGLTLMTAGIFASRHTPLDETAGYAYGADFENDVFVMHPSCLCEKKDCAWCAVCTCDDSTWHYFIDNVEVDYDTYDEYFTTNAGECPLDEESWEAYEQTTIEVNSHRRAENTPTCYWCLHPELKRANFEHKQSGTRITWYKYIGRSMRSEIVGDWLAIVTECLISLQTPRS